MSARRRYRTRRQRRRHEPDYEFDVDPGQLETFLHYQSRREQMHQEATRILDDRLDLAKDAAPWHTATFSTLAAATLATALTLTLTGFTWWFLLPTAASAVCLWLVIRSVKELRRSPSHRSYHREDEPPLTPQ